MTDQVLRSALLHMTLTAVLREGSVPEPLRTEAEAVLAGRTEGISSRNCLALSALDIIRSQPNCRQEVEAQLGEEIWDCLTPGPCRYLRYWPEDHGHYIGVPVADDPDRQE